MDYRVHEVTKSQTRLSNFHIQVLQLDSSVWHVEFSIMQSNLAWMWRHHAQALSENFLLMGAADTSLPSDNQGTGEGTWHAHKHL